MLPSGTSHRAHPTGHIPPAEAETNYYANLETPLVAAYPKPNSLRKIRNGSVEAVGAATRYAFETLDARLVTVSHAEDNGASARLIAKLGFERTARRLLCYEIPDGTLVDEIGYSATGPERLPDQSLAWGAVGEQTRRGTIAGRAGRWPMTLMSAGLR